MITFAVCPGDTEINERLKFWEKISQDLEKYIEEKVNLITFSGFFEERVKLNEEDFDIYYANPIIAYRLFQKGYIPAVKLKGKNEEFVLIGYDKTLENKDLVKTISSVYLETHILPLLYYEEFDFTKIKVIYTDLQKDVYRAVKSKSIDLGIIDVDFYDSIKDENKVPVLKSMPTNKFYSLMVKPEIYKKVKNFFEDKEEFETITENQFMNSYKTAFNVESLFKVKEFYDMSKTIYEAPFVGVLVYHNKIIYANEYIQKMLGYSMKELKQLSMVDMVEDEYKEMIRETVNRRLKGEFFYKIYNDLRIKTKDGSIRNTIGIANTILYGDKYSGFVLAVDITKQKRYEKLYRALRNINKAISIALTEDELYKIVCETFVKELDINFVWIGKPDKEKKFFENVYKCGEDYGFLDVIKIAVGGDYSFDKCPTNIAFTEGKIFINSNTKNFPIMKQWQKEMLKRNFQSSAAVPIKKIIKLLQY